MTIFVTCYQPVPMNYQHLGDHIREVNIRNRELRVNNLLGLSVSKEFMPSIANTIGTDMSSYKIVVRGQLVYIADTSRRGDKIAIAMLDKYENAIVSQAYTVFEVIDTDKLLPEYLMMWFRRPEFDRYARFHSHGSAREVFDWEEMCDVRLPVPPIERQREIVAEYETLTRRIYLNEQIIQRLEATAQALYRNTFIDNIDKQNLPPGWHLSPLGDICKVKYGKAHEGIPEGDIPIYGSGGIMRYGNKALFKKPSVLIPRKGSLNNVFYIDQPFWTVDTMFYTVLTDDFVTKYLYLFLKQFDFLAMDVGSAVPSMTVQTLNQMELIMPEQKVLRLFDDQVSTLFKAIKSRKQETEKLTELQSLLLAKMGQ